MCPRSRLFKLSSEAEQSGIVGEAAGELDANGKASFVPVKRNAHGGLAGLVEDLCVRRVDNLAVGQFA